MSEFGHFQETAEQIDAWPEAEMAMSSVHALTERYGRLHHTFQRFADARTMTEMRDIRCRLEEFGWTEAAA